MRPGSTCTAFFHTIMVPFTVCLPLIIGTLRSDDSDGNGNATKAIGLISKTTVIYFARASRFFVHFFAVTARLQRENA